MPGYCNAVSEIYITHRITYMIPARTLWACNCSATYTQVTYDDGLRLRQEASREGKSYYEEITGETYHGYDTGVRDDTHFITGIHTGG